MRFRLSCALLSLLLLLPVVIGDDASTASSTEATTTLTVAPNQNNPNPTTVAKTCPSGRVSTSDCSGSDCGSNDAVCVKDLKDDNNKAYSGCCDSLNEFCPETKMHSYHSENSKKFSVGFSSNEGYYPRGNGALWSGMPTACPVPYSFSLNYAKRPTLPVGWDQAAAEANSGFIQTACTANDQCKEDEFCGAAFNPTFQHLNSSMKGLDQSIAGQPVRFCYKLPATEANMAHVRPDGPVGLKLCNSHADCGDVKQVCHSDQKVFFNETSADPMAGICMTVSFCEQEEKIGVLTSQSTFCSAPSDCQGTGVAVGGDAEVYEPFCLNYQPAEASRKLCCFKKLVPCRVGKPESPQTKTCSKQTDCAPFDKPYLWCNDVPTERYCCKSGAEVKNNDLWACPDGATPLFNEPFCKGYNTVSNTSGTCSKQGSMCYNGHCCPKLTRVLKETGGNKTEVSSLNLGEHAYVTEVPCDPSKIPPMNYIFAFCDPDSKKVVVAGKFHRGGTDTMTAVSGSSCTSNKDCAKHGNAICMTVGSEKRMCYFNPLKSLRKQVSTVWKAVLIVSLICAALFLICTILMFVCYRSKSVFDKYKPKKKKGKDGKDSKGKDSKSKDSKSKDSKSSTKEEDKKGKKKGKKGKKGGDDSSTDSKQDDPGAGGTEKGADSAAPGDPPADPAADLGGAPADPAPSGAAPPPPPM